MCLRVIWSFSILNLLFTLSAFAQIRLCPISRFFRFGLGRRYAALSPADSSPFEYWQIQEHLLYFSWSCSHCPCDHNTCGPLLAFQLRSCRDNVHSVPPCDNRICDLSYSHTFIEPQCHSGQRYPHSANKCIAQQQNPLALSSLMSSRVLSTLVYHRGWRLGIWPLLTGLVSTLIFESYDPCSFPLPSEEYHLTISRWSFSLTPAIYNPKGTFTQSSLWLP